MIKKGDRVKIVNSIEANNYKNCIFDVISDPYCVCGTMVVKIKCNVTGKYFGGGYATQFLEIVKEND